MQDLKYFFFVFKSASKYFMIKEMHLLELKDIHEFCGETKCKQNLFIYDLKLFFYLKCHTFDLVSQSFNLVNSIFKFIFRLSIS